MQRRILVAPVAALLLITLAPASGLAESRRTTPLDRDGDKVYDNLERQMEGRSADARVEVIALFSEGESSGEIAQAKSAIGGFRVIRPYDYLSGVAAEMTIGQVRALAARPDTLQIQPNSRIEMALSTARAAVGADKAAADFGEDGNNELSAICPEVRNYCKDDVVTAVLDSGINYYHPDLDGGKVLGGVNCTTGECNSTFSHLDGSGHGTHSASVIAGEGDENPAHRGVAPGSALVALKIGSSSTSVAILDAALEWTIANREAYGIELMNMSLNATTASDGTESSARLTNKAAAAGILPVAASGNAGPNYGTVSFPSSAKYSLSVGAMADPNDAEGGFAPGWALASMSGRGPTLDGRTRPDLIAPGVDITTATAGSGYWTSSGTSLAAPFAAGAAALALDADPTLGMSGTPCDSTDTSTECADGVIDSTMTTSLKNTLTSTAVDWGTPGQDNDYGYGRLDAYAAVDAASPLIGSGGPAQPRHTFMTGSVAGTGASATHTLEVTRLNAPVAATLLWDRAVGLTTPNFDLALLGPSGNQVASSVSTNNARHEVLGYVPTSTGTYTLRVTSANGGGNYSLDASFPGEETIPGEEPPPATEPPSSPANLTATAASSSSIDLNWDNASGETSFRIERSTDAAGPWAQVGTTSADVTRFGDTGLQGKTTYYYRVVAVNSVGESSPSNTAWATTPEPAPTAAPTAPANLTATPTSSSQIDLSWSDVAGDAGYKIERSPNGSSKWAQIGTTPKDVATFSNTGLNAATTYYYRVRATNSFGTSNPSNVASAKTLSGTTPTNDTTAPLAPQNLSGKVVKGKISLSWTGSTDTGGSGLKGYKVFRSTSVTGTFTLVASPSTTSWSDGLVSRGTTYWYYVKAVDNAGNESAASNVVSVSP